MATPTAAHNIAQRTALTARGVEREYGIARDRVCDAIRAGELPAARIGRRVYTILRRDIEAWLSAHRVVPADAARRVDEVLGREARRA